MFYELKVKQTALWALQLSPAVYVQCCKVF